MGSTTCSESGFAVLQPSFRLGKWGKGNSFIFFGISFMQMALATPAMRSPSLFFLLSVTVCPALFTSYCCWACRPFSLPCTFKVLFYLKCWMRLAGYSDWQVWADVSIVVYYSMTGRSGLNTWLSSDRCVGAQGVEHHWLLSHCSWVQIIVNIRWILSSQLLRSCLMQSEYIFASALPT